MKGGGGNDDDDELEHHSQRSQDCNHFSVSKRHTIVLITCPLSTLPTTPMADVPNKNTSVLHYNVRWMDGVFKSRTTTEALLSPQREAGNLTTHDYDASISFLPGYHRRYPVCH